MLPDGTALADVGPGRAHAVRGRAGRHDAAVRGAGAGGRARPGVRRGPRRPVRVAPRHRNDHRHPRPDRPAVGERAADAHRRGPAASRRRGGRGDPARGGRRAPAPTTGESAGATLARPRRRDGRRLREVATPSSPAEPTVGSWPQTPYASVWDALVDAAVAVDEVLAEHRRPARSAHRRRHRPRRDRAHARRHRGAHRRDAARPAGRGVEHQTRGVLGIERQPDRGSDPGRAADVRDPDRPQAQRQPDQQLRGVPQRAVAAERLDLGTDGRRADPGQRGRRSGPARRHHVRAARDAVHRPPRPAGRGRRRTGGHPRSAGGSSTRSAPRATRPRSRATRSPSGCSGRSWPRNSRCWSSWRPGRRATTAHRRARSWTT